MDIRLIRRVLNEKASILKARDVAEWFATPEGQQFLEKEIERDLKSTYKCLKEKK